ncbi:hypothetical protein A5740_23145 [Mycobacterium sp. GA-1841]|uniref:hypothetical protein n=1 Tax=Mycobacterium sp. GA-1841 TaxID=1834154 RepID=UPI00096D2FDC|nr:hypothetical protein [Mycobacterium sp. GA-1841]OMC41367.1 hypothetical protein A5740_23145 [Mycobacterium sp. GA-1841]
MTSQCSPSIDAITHKLGFTCQDSPALLRLSSPAHLSNWTLPVLELLIVAGAAFALWWAVRRHRRENDPVNLMLWSATVLYLLIVEPPLYFPTVFGVDQSIGAVFAHNIFTVQFLYDRLPLYIVALYPAMATLAYEIVRSLGIFRARGAIIGSVCVGFVHNLFYEVFDHLGPQLQWWAWNTETPVNRPMLASVPMSSLLLFATVGPAVLTFLVVTFAGRAHGGENTLGVASLALRTLGAAVLMPVALVVVNVPIALAKGDDPDGAWRWAVYVVFLALFAGISLWAIAGQLGSLRRSGEYPADRPNNFVRIFGSTYLIVMAGLWISALPAHFSSHTDTSTAATPLGSLPYVIVCFVLAALTVAAVSVTGRPAAADEPDRPESVPAAAPGRKENQ